MAELEGKRRKFSEAMQENMNMFSKMMEKEGSPKHKATAAAAAGGGGGGCSDTSCHQGGNGGSMGSSSNTASGAGAGVGGTVTPAARGTQEDTQAAGSQKEAGPCGGSGSSSPSSVFDSPRRKARPAPLETIQQSPESPEDQEEDDFPSRTTNTTAVPGKGSRYEICTFGDVMQVVEVQRSSKRGGGNSTGGGGGIKQPRSQPHPQALSPVSLAASRRLPREPLRWLCLVGFLAYTFFVVPLPSYLTGLSLGIACGFMMGLVAVMLLAPKRQVRRPLLPQRPPPSPDDSMPTDSLSKTHTDHGLLQVSVGSGNGLYNRAV